MSETAQNVEDFETPKAQQIESPEPDKDLEIEVIDDRPQEDQKVSRVSDDDEVDNEIEGIGNRTKKRIDKLKYDYHEERRSKEQASRTRDEAIQYAQALQQENEKLKNTVSRSEGALINSLKTRSTTAIDAAKAEYRTAYDAGDTDKLLEAQEKLNSAFADKNYVENYVPQATTQPQNNQQQQLSQQQFAQQQQQQFAQQQTQTDQSYDPKAIEYIRNNEWFEKEGNEDMTALAYGMHAKLIRKGIDPIRDADQYYDEIDTAVRNRFPEKFETNTATSQRPSTVVAPANRSGTKQRRVQLTRTQVDLARRLGLTPEQYATQFSKELNKNG